MSEMSTRPDEPLTVALTWVNEGRGVALATVVDTWGSSPRPRGSQLVVRDDGLFVGSVSGGCVEGKVVEAASAAIADGAHRLLEFGVSNEDAWDVGLACGGTIRIYVAPIRRVKSEHEGPLVRATLERIAREILEKRAVVLLTPLDGSPVRLWFPGDAPLAPALRDAVDRALRNDDATRIDSPEGALFVQAILPPLTLLIVGAVHVAQPLARMATVLGYAATIVDPREAFARAERWPDFGVVNAWPDEAVATRPIDARTAVVTLTHDPKIDDVALELALKSDAFYIGALGSKKTHTQRVERLGARGFSAETVSRIHGPVGLPIGAKSPAEIAISILAEMTETLRAPKPLQ